MAKHKTVEDIDAQIAALKAAKRELQSKERKRERADRTAALAVIGGEVLRAAGCDWRSIDYQALAAVLERHRTELRGCATGDQDTAKERMTDWKRYRRTGAAAPAAQAAQRPAEAAPSKARKAAPAPVPVPPNPADDIEIEAMYQEIKVSFDGYALSQMRHRSKVLEDLDAAVRDGRMTQAHRSRAIARWDWLQTNR